MKRSWQVYGHGYEAIRSHVSLYWAIYLLSFIERPGEPELDLPCKMRNCNEENRQRCAEENRWMHFVWFRVYSGSRRAGTWSIEDCFHEPVRFPGLRSSDMGSMRLLWLCQEVDMDVLNKNQRFEELDVLREDEEEELPAIADM